MHIVSNYVSIMIHTLVKLKLFKLALLGAFGIIRLMTNMQYLQADMDDEMKATNYGSGVSAIPFGILKLIFSAIFLLIAIMQLQGIYDIF